MVVATIARGNNTDREVSRKQKTPEIIVAFYELEPPETRWAYKFHVFIIFRNDHKKSSDTNEWSPELSLSLKSVNSTDKLRTGWTKPKVTWSSSAESPEKTFQKIGFSDTISATLLHETRVRANFGGFAQSGG